MSLFRRRTLGAVFIGLSSAAIAAPLGPAPKEPLRTTRESVMSVSTNPPPPDLPPHLRRGYELAHLYCQACHLFPEPKYLTKAAWINGALRMMALRLGAARLNYEQHPDGQILKEAHVFPDEPLLSREEWMAICDYFREMAPENPLPQAPRPPIHPELKQFEAHELPCRTGEPWTTLVKIDSERGRLFLGDAAATSLAMFDRKGRFVKSVPVDSGPVSMVFKDGGAYLTLIGRIFPSDQLAGKIVFASETNSEFSVRTVLDHLRRPTDVAFADLNGDGRDDLIVSEFGHTLGEFSWFENLGNGRFEQHVLFDRPGAIRAWTGDLSRTGRSDMIVLMAQAREGVYHFQNQGQGEFLCRPIVEYPPVWGSTYFQVVDFNGDGFDDLLVVNGDSGDYVSPTKSFHGIRLYLNDGHNQFKEAWSFPLNGAFKAMAADFDGDGDLDIAAISFFPDYLHSPEESFVYLENKGGLQFDAYSLPEHIRGRWLTMDVGDLDGDGRPDIVLGSFINGPLSIPIPAAVRAGWKTNHVAALLLHNLQKPKR
jgi:hypothetical protein